MEPVLIAGGGPVGLVAALLLARWEVPSVILEAAPEHTPAGSRAICFQRDVLDVLDRAGVAGELLAEGVTWTTGRTFYRSRELFTVTFPDPGRSALPPWINVSQDSAERALLGRVRAEPLIELRFGHRVCGVVQDEDGVTAEVMTGPSGRPGRAGGSHLIAADGGRSTVRQALGIGFPGRSYPDQFLICDIRAELPFPAERRFYFDPDWNPGRQVLVHHCPGGVWRIDWQVPDGFDLAAERAGGGLDTRIGQLTGGRPFELVWASAYRFGERVAERFAAGRVFLAGDAAHLYAPFGARGLNSGIADAENLAWKLAFVRRGWAPGALLESYHAERSAAAAENLRVTSATMEFLVPQTAELRSRREMVLERAVTDPAARALIDSGKLAEPYWYTASTLTTPGPSLAGFPADPGALRPPVPGVLCPDAPCRAADGTVTRLRRLLGRSFVVLAPSAAAAGRAAWLARAIGGAPVDGYPLDQLDDTGAIRRALAATGSSVHVIRPDGHLAAVLPGWDAPALAAALRRATGWDQGAPPQAAGRDAATSRQTAGPCRDTGLSRPTPAP